MDSLIKSYKLEFTNYFGSNNEYRIPLTTILIYNCLIFILIWYVKYLWKRRYMYYHSWNIPGPFALPFIGIGYMFLSPNCNIMDIIQKVQNTFPDICAAWFGPKVYYLVAKPEHIEKILTSSKALNKDHLYKFLSNAVGDGLLTAKATTWKRHRKAIMPAFNQKILDYFQEIFATNAEELRDLLQKEVGNKNLDLFEYVSNCALQIICKTAMGLDINCQNSDFGKNLDRMMDITIIRIFNIWFHLDLTWSLFPISKEYSQVVKKFKGFTREVVKLKLKEYEKIATRKDSDAQIEEGSYKLRNGKIAFLDLIIENTNFTEQELQEEVDIFMITGSDTSATTVCCLYLIMGMFPDIQQKVLDEILDIVGPDRRVLPSDLPKMKYIDRVIKETLRLFPIAAFFLREIEEDIDGGDMVFPAGSSAFFGCVHIHRNPKYWPDPMKFDPDRFLPENVAKRHPCTYIPFSYGPRNCIGARYGLLNVKTILATTLRKFKAFTHYKRLEDVALDTHIVLRLKDGPKVWLEAR